ncbi:hypothetical protein C4J81_11105 [Deltaproteobacteria bacterium Smac51]|nr:hypothetical protein C4J81_11105 [Deltaproteobacteria bacterium Smac51]
MAKNFYLGIDTGGTHTDAVVYDPGSRTVVVSAKAETTHHDLVIGISQALENLGRLSWDGGFGAISRINLSTTLATNAIAESLGNRVGLVMMGYDKDQEAVKKLISELPQVETAFVGGSHNYYGQEEEPLDDEAVKKVVLELEPKVSGWAVSGFFSVKNPDHEMRVASIIKSVSAKPVTMGRDLTGELNAVRRAATAALNAGLIIIIGRLLDAVKEAAAKAGLTASLMVVKGDGSLVSEDWAREKPIETVVSGPAAGLVGAKVLARGFLSPQEKNLWVLDVGGTTTDMAFVENGLPAVNPNGARVGKWDTMTLAVETRTRGLGGDSLVTIDSRGFITLGPRRVLPLCRLARKWPKALETLKSQKALMTPSTVAGYFFVPGTPPESNIGRDEAAILEAMSREVPFPMARYAEEAFEGNHHFIGLKALSHPSVMVSAFTPTDAMAVLGLYNGGAREASAIGAEILARHLKWKAEEVAVKVLDEFGRALAQEIVSYGFERDGIDFRPEDFAENGIFGGMLGRRAQGRIAVGLSAADTVVLLGAPVNVLSPFLAKNLSARILVPPVFEVASAVGAAASPVYLTRRVEIHTLPNFIGYRLFMPDQVIDGDSVDGLVKVAEEKMTTYMYSLAAMAGERGANVSFTREDRRVLLNDGSNLHLGAALIFTATKAH